MYLNINIWKSCIWTADKDKIMWRSSQWRCFNLSGWKEETWKNSGLNGNRTHDLCDTGAWVRFPFKPEFFQVSSFQPLRLKLLHCDDLHIILMMYLSHWNYRKWINVKTLDISDFQNLLGGEGGVTWVWLASMQIDIVLYYIHRSDMLPP